jgi:hypothetical protein
MCLIAIQESSEVVRIHQEDIDGMRKFVTRISVSPRRSSPQPSLISSPAISSADLFGPNCRMPALPQLVLGGFQIDAKIAELGRGLAKRLQARPGPFSEPPGASYIIALTSLEVQFVPIRSTQVRSPPAGAARLRWRLGKEGTVVGGKPSWIRKSVLEGYVGDRSRQAVTAFEGRLHSRQAPAA